MIENMIRNRVTTMIRLVIAGIEENNEFTTTFSPSFLETILNGLNAQRALKALRDFKSLTSASEFAN